MSAGRLLHLLLILASIILVAGLAYVYVKPPENLRCNRDGVPYYTPPVIHPVSGEAVPVETLVKHYTKGRS